MSRRRGWGGEGPRQRESRRCAGRWWREGRREGQRTPVSDVPLPPPLTPGHPLFGLGYSSTHREYPYVALHGDAATSSSAEVAEEVPIAFVYNGRPHVVMMATPSDFEDFGTGFSLSEEIVGSLSELERIEVVPYSQGVELQIQIPPARAEAVAGRDRQLAGRTGCGLCGCRPSPTRSVRRAPSRSDGHSGRARCGGPSRNSRRGRS